MFLTRALTVLIALPIFAAALIFLPQWLWALFLLPALAIGAWEWGGLGGYRSASRIAYAAFVTVSALAAGYCAMQHSGGGASCAVWLYGLSVAFWALVAPFWLGQRWTLRNPIVLGAAGWIALVPMWLALVQLQQNPWALLLFMSIVWVADTFAYIAGRQFGRHKLAPLISPGKSWEGVAGAAAALVIYWAILWFVAGTGERFFAAGVGLLVFLAILALSIEGDLFESWLKRQAGLKDSGHLLPGHGGILDRVDGLTSTMPAAALLLYLN